VISAIGIGVTMVAIMASIAGISISMGVAIAIAISIRIAIVTIVMRSISLSLRLGISRPLAKALGRPGLEGGAGGVESNTGVGTIGIGVSIAIGIRIAIVAIQSRGISLRLSISRPLADALDRPVCIRGAIRVASNSIQIGISISMAISIRIAVVTIQSRGISLGLSISRPLAPAPEAGGREPGSRNTRPVRVGVVDGRVCRVVGPIEVARVSLSIRGCIAPNQKGRQNLNRKNVDKKNFGN
jgi:hypothetical protein